MLSFNSKTVAAVKFTGKDAAGTQVTNKDLTDVICNGTHVWCKPPSFGSQHKALVGAVDADGKKYYTIKLEVVNNSTRSVTYTFNCGVPGIPTTDYTLAAGETRTVSISTGTTLPTSTCRWTVTYLEDTVSFITKKSE